MSLSTEMKTKASKVLIPIRSFHGSIRALTFYIDGYLAEKWRFKMITGLIVTAVVLVVLYGLIASTEKILTQRQQYMVIDERMTEHRSRL
jgi:hypothetical protein